MGKVKTIEELVPILQLQRELGRKIVLCHGVFDIVHPGHRKHLIASKAKGDILVVTVTPDKFVNKGPGTPRFNEELRLEGIASLEYVDYVALNEWPTAVEALLRLRPDIYSKGSDYKNLSKDVTLGILREKEAVESIGGILSITEEEVVFSSTALLNESLNVFSKEAREFLFKLKKDYPLEKTLEMLDSLKDLRVLVVGDTIVDQYIFCSILGASPKDNILTSRYLDEESFAGGVLAVANHISSLCDKVSLVTLVGKDGWEPFIREHLKTNIELELLTEDIPTTVKTKFVEPDSFTKMFGITHITNSVPRQGFDEELTSLLKEKIKNTDLVIICDFGHGFLSTESVEFLSSDSPYLALNAQTNSANIGFNPANRYLSADYICIDELELRLACRERLANVEPLMESLRHLLGAKTLTITRGKAGSLSLSDSRFITVPSMSSGVIDKVGAGDAYLALSSPCACKEYSPEFTGFIGNVASALKLRTVSNKTPIDKIQLYKYITTLLK